MTSFSVHPFIITLGTIAIYRGVAFVQTNWPIDGRFPGGVFVRFVRQEMGGLTLVPLIVMIVVLIVGGIFFSQLSIGRKIYAVGGERDCKPLQRDSRRTVKLLAYTLSGLAAGIAAVLSSVTMEQVPRGTAEVMSSNDRGDGRRRRKPRSRLSDCSWRAAGAIILR